MKYYIFQPRLSFDKIIFKSKYKIIAKIASFYFHTKDFIFANQYRVIKAKYTKKKN